MSDINSRIEAAKAEVSDYKEATGRDWCYSDYHNGGRRSLKWRESEKKPRKDFAFMCLYGFQTSVYARVEKCVTVERKL